MTKEKFLDPNIPNKSKTVEEKFNYFSTIIYLPLPTEIEISSSAHVIESVHFVLEATQTLLIKKNLFLILFMKNYAWSSKS